MDRCDEFSASCWHVLGLLQQRRLQLKAHADGVAMLTERDITKAYREKARETHPDRFHDVADKERATIEFRRIHDAKEEALEAVRNLTKQHACDVCFTCEEHHQQDGQGEYGCSQEKADHPSSQPRSRRPNTGVQQMATMAYDELHREFNDKQSHRFKVILESLLQTWPDKNQTWAIFRSSFPLLSHLKSAGLRPDIYNHLERCQGEWFNKYAISKQLRLQKLVKQIEDDWNSHREQILQHVQCNWSASDLKDVSNMAISPEIAEALWNCYGEKMRQFHERRTAVIKKAAEDIASAFPDKLAMKLILKSIRSQSERTRVFDYLPEDMRKLMGGLCSEYDASYIEQKQTNHVTSSNDKYREPRDEKKQDHKSRYDSHNQPPTYRDANVSKNKRLKLLETPKMMLRRCSPSFATIKSISKTALQIVVFAVLASRLHHRRYLASLDRYYSPIAASVKASVSIPVRVAKYLWSFIA